MLKAASPVMGIVVLLMAVVAGPQPSHALLIEKDLNAIGDNLITLDTATNLEWLDVTATLGQSFDQAVLSGFVTSQGFRHATNNEVAALYTSVGITVHDGSLNGGAQFSGALELLQKLGCTVNCATTLPFQKGWTEQVPATAFVGHPQIQAHLSLGLALANCTSPTSAPCTINIPKDEIQGAIGNYLVRTAIGEPPILVLITLGLVGLGFTRCKRAA